MGQRAGTTAGLEAARATIEGTAASIATLGDTAWAALGDIPGRLEALCEALCEAGEGPGTMRAPVPALALPGDAVAALGRCHRELAAALPGDCPPDLLAAAGTLEGICADAARRAIQG